MEELIYIHVNICNTCVIDVGVTVCMLCNPWCPICGIRGESKNDYNGSMALRIGTRVVRLDLGLGVDQRKLKAIYDCNWLGIVCCLCGS